MVSDNRCEWPEHAVCARCAAPLDENYRLSPLGVRFCSECFDKKIQDKVRERAAKIYLKGHCSNCGRSLINGYRLSTLGVLYCTSCCDNLSQSPSEKADEQAATDAVPDKVGRKVSLMVAEGVLWTSLFVSHLLFFTHLLSLPNSRWHIPHPDSYFKGLICLDFLTLFFLLASKRLSTSRFGFLWALLIASGFIILVGREIVSLIG